MEWTPGEPKKANWYLAAYLTKDDPPNVAVDLLWFNPDALPKWWTGTVGRCVEFVQPVTHWMPKPQAPGIEKEGYERSISYICRHGNRHAGGLVDRRVR